MHHIDTNSIFSNFFDNKIIAVTGGVGSVGVELISKLLDHGVKEVRCIDNNESALFELGSFYCADERLRIFHADITDEWEMLRVFGSVDYVFHAAALKHVPSCEVSPFSAVNTNIIGIKTIIRSAQENGVKKVLFTSSDKAVSPTNVMGASKLMGEKLFIAANFMAVGPDATTLFSSTRFGNIAGSSGSVIPLFCDQIQKGGPVTITDTKMSRFMMGMSHAADLVLKSMVYSQGGEILITKMPAMMISDIADVLIEKIAPQFGYDPSKIEKRIIGARLGEKRWEELSTDEESKRILENDNYLCVLPAQCNNTEEVRDHYLQLGFKDSRCVYTSETASKLSKQEVFDFLRQPGVLPFSLRTQLLDSIRLVDAPTVPCEKETTGFAVSG
ncbi:polysaccharide biosynthesis protein [Sneathiella marina]|uniref:Polysaccharide biosynthesis protein n=1 Tax=Sneathiella marina TaxID=2950108 RepID=A0ABY4W6L0_9PROT|nr:polysaccharide biosynthesis protein [Sneathiella marina]USG62803.1 polysaccharide biosynthesis protein [Sneathiella marina]